MIIEKNKEKDIGYYENVVDGSGLTSGVYFYRVTLNGKQYIGVKKMILIK